MALLLEIDRLTAGYGRIEVLHELSLGVPEGAVVAMLGANGAGKTTTLRAVAGTLPAWSGSIRVDGRRTDGLSAYEIATRGVTLIPEGRGIFPGLAVGENLDIAADAARDVDEAWRRGRRRRVLEMFPRLQERVEQRGGTLSGGEQQMLALSRAFLAAPRVLLLDEISMGLAPRVVEQLFESVSALREEGLTIVLVEQYLTYALRLADICYVLAKGRVAFAGEPAELRTSRALASSYLGTR
ncbi:MAG TPA: ABC transporter ATP-binding protein [Acidimicrobiales bacterium]|nr:ABC transporter ATP-binding protein [Acidimicrobiales bacterium]